MNATPATLRSQVSFARRQNRSVPVYRTETGDVPTDLRTGQRLVRVPNNPAAVCPEVQQFGEHVLSEVMADLPGDRSVGYCVCGEYIDTGTWDERNGER